MTGVFVDTSAFFALTDADDRNHDAAARALKRLGKARRGLVTSTYVIDEVITLVRMRLGHRTAVELGERLERTRWCHVVEVTHETRMVAWQIFVRYDDRSFSLTDCTSFALMRGLGLAEAFTFDRKDFAAAGFTPIG